MKIDYEKAWKGLKEEYGEYRIDCENMDDIRLEIVMDSLEKEHTKEQKEYQAHIYNV